MSKPAPKTRRYRVEFEVVESGAEHGWLSTIDYEERIHEAIGGCFTTVPSESIKVWRITPERKHK